MNFNVDSVLSVTIRYDRWFAPENWQV